MAASRRGYWLLAIALALGIAWGWHRLGLADGLTLESLRDSRDLLRSTYAAQPAGMLAAYAAAYVAMAALSIPGAAVMTLAGGAIFGFTTGLVVVSFASSVGALLAFLVARHLLRYPVQRRFGASLAPVNEGIARDGAFHLFALRLVPVFPFWLVNLLMGLTPMGALRYYLVSQVGMLPATAVYVNAGTRLGEVSAPGDVLSPALLASFALLGLFPLLARLGLRALRRRRLLARWPRPRRYDRNLIVIGAGAGGLVSAYVAAAAGARVTLVEAGRMGGDCLNTGCVPSKALIRAARSAHASRSSAQLGVTTGPAQVDFAAVMRRVRRVIGDIAPHDSVERYTALGVEVLQGRARLVSPWAVEITGPQGERQTLTSRGIIIAAGAAPAVPAIPGLESAGALTSETLWSLDALPPRLLVLGGGPVGVELAQAFARLGSRVTLVERSPRLLAREDQEAADCVRATLEAEGVRVMVAHSALQVERAAQGWQLRVAPVQAPAADAAAAPGASSAQAVVEFDRILCATGRRARVSGYGLEALGLVPVDGGPLETDACLRTGIPGVYAVGDVTGPLQLTHAASHQAWHAAMNALFGGLWQFRVDDSVIPRVTFTDPEVASVGLTEEQARERGVPFELTRYELGDLDRAIADGTARGFVKVLTVPGRDRIVGVTIVGDHAGELIAEYALAMRHRLGLSAILRTVHAYPTWSEANRHVAGAWRRARLPGWSLRVARRYHRWRRG